MQEGSPYARAWKDRLRHVDTARGHLDRVLTRTSTRTRRSAFYEVFERCGRQWKSVRSAPATTSMLPGTA